MKEPRQLSPQGLALNKQYLELSQSSFQTQEQINQWFQCRVKLLKEVVSYQGSRYDGSADVYQVPKVLKDEAKKKEKLHLVTYTSRHTSEFPNVNLNRCVEDFSIVIDYYVILLPERFALWEPFKGKVDSIPFYSYTKPQQESILSLILSEDYVSAVDASEAVIALGI